MAVGGGCVRYIVCSVLLLAQLATAQHFVLVHKPSYMRLRQSTDDIRLTEVQDALALMFGLDAGKDIHWDGLFAGSVFRRPRAIVLVVAEGAAQRVLSLDSDKSYLLNMDDLLVSTFRLESRLRAVYQNDALIVELSAQYKLRDLQEEYSPLFDSVPSGKHAVIHSLRTDPDSVISLNDLAALNVNESDNYHVIVELETARHLLKKAGERHASSMGATHGADFFAIYLDGFLKVARTHGFDSTEASEAWRLTESSLKKVEADARRLYGDNLVFAVMTLPPASLSEQDRTRHARYARSLLSTNDTGNSTEPPVYTNKTINLATSYRSDYNAIFNICLWFCIIFFLVVVYVAFGVWHMDPGRDSIIYRMTTQRMKKDN